MFLGIGIGFAVWAVMIIKNPHLVPAKTFSSRTWGLLFYIPLVSFLGGVLVLLAANTFSMALLGSLGSIIFLSVAQWIIRMGHEAQASQKGISQ